MFLKFIFRGSKILSLVWEKDYLFLGREPGENPACATRGGRFKIYSIFTQLKNFFTCLL